jgi:hypothetical protein
VSALVNQWRREQTEWLQEQTERHQKGLCVFCGLSLRECWCGEDEPVEYRPVSDGSDEVGVA